MALHPQVCIKYTGCLVYHSIFHLSYSLRTSLVLIHCLHLLYSIPFYKIMVPTVDTVRYDFLVYSLLQAKRPVLLTGPVGTGKTSLAQKVLQRLDPKIYSLLVINMSAQVRGTRNQTIVVYRRSYSVTLIPVFLVVTGIIYRLHRANA